jgi:hypothetical protein
LHTKIIDVVCIFGKLNTKASKEEDFNPQTYKMQLTNLMKKMIVVKPNHLHGT